MNFNGGPLTVDYDNSISTNNSTKTIIAPFATWTGAWENVTAYTTVGVTIKGDNATDGTLYIESSQDGGITVNSVPYTITNASFQLPKIWNIVESHIRIRYTNGAVTQTGHFQIQTKYSVGQPLGLLQTAGDIINENTDLQIVKSVNTGIGPTGLYTNEKTDGIAFRTEVLLTTATSLIYTSPVTSMLGYSQIETHLASDAAGLLIGTWYNDEAKTTILRTFNRPYTGLEVGTISYFSSPIFGPYLEYVYTSVSDQSFFFLDLHNKTKSISGQIIGMNDFIPSGVVANLGRNVLVGQDENGSFRNTNVDFNGNLDVTIAEPLTAFGDLRIAELTPQVQLTFSYNVNTEQVYINEVNGATITQGSSMIILTSGTSTNAEAHMESIRHMKYRAGLGSLARFTCMYETGGVAGATQVCGVGNDENAFVFGFNGTSFGIMTRRTNGTTVDTWVPQSSWSEDVMDGTGRTGQTLDHTKINVYAIQYQYLGAGEINFKIEDSVSGKFVTVHKIKYANANILPSTFNPDFPLYMDILKTSGATSIIMKSASMSGFCEGKSTNTGVTSSFSANSTHTTETAICHLQNVTTYASIENRVSSYVTSLGLSNDTSRLATFKVYRGATLTGTPSWTNLNGTNSVMQSDVVQAYSSGGTVMFSASLAKDSGQYFQFSEFEMPIRPSDIITITSVSTNSAEMGISILLKDDF